MRLVKTEKGFTLIELLIVIVIIGILAGVLVAVIDPDTQQNRARDAAVQATINKVALAVGGYVSAYGEAPADDELIGNLNANAQEVGTTCSGDAETLVCEFTVQGVDLPAATSDSACAANGYDPQGAAASGTACNFVYFREADDDPDFKIGAKSFGRTENMFVYSSSLSAQRSDCPSISTTWGIEQNADGDDVPVC